jgi:hypothetical protein
MMLDATFQAIGCDGMFNMHEVSIGRSRIKREQLQYE